MVTNLANVTVGTCVVGDTMGLFMEDRGGKQSGLINVVLGYGFTCRFPATAKPTFKSLRLYIRIAQAQINLVYWM